MTPAPRVRMTGPERRSSILVAAREAFLASGYGGARTRDIAERAGVNEALLFRHFATKEEIFKEAVVEPLIEIMGTSLASETTEPGEQLEEKRQHAVLTMRRLLEVMQSAVPLLGVVLFSDDQQSREVYRTCVLPILDAGSKRLRQRYGTWDHRSYNTDLMVRASTGMCLFLALDAHFTGKKLDLDATAEELAAIVTYGVAARPGVPRAASRAASTRSRPTSGSRRGAPRRRPDP